MRKPLFKNAWMPFLTRRFRTDPFTRSLPQEVRDTYLGLLFIAWDENGILQSWITKPGWIPAEIGISRRKFKAHWAQVQHKFTLTSSGVYVNLTQESERDRAEERSEKARNAAEALHRKRLLAQPGMQSDHIHNHIHNQDLKEIPSAPTGAGGFDFEAIYQAYPRKLGKKRGIQRCKSKVTSQAKFDQLKQAVANYARHVAGKDLEYVKHFDSFMSNWEDWIAVDVSQVNGTQRPQLRDVREILREAEERKEREDAEHAKHGV